jgi:hypothetical protein
MPTETPTSTPTSTPFTCLGTPDGTSCDPGTDAAQTKICVSETCVTCTAFAGTPRFVDNSDGTLTDRSTCLVWEKKTTTGSSVNLEDPHDAGNTYSWSTGTNNPDGTVFTKFLASLNAGAGFAAHKDWRLPSEEGRNPPLTGTQELETILRAANPCSGLRNPCIDAAFGPTQPFGYWSATTAADGPNYAWFVDFFDGYVDFDSKTTSRYARAVRGGL